LLTETSHKGESELTELEGAILGVLRRTRDFTAYSVRQVFRASRSEEWSGSAGAVYPAIARMKAAGLVTARAASDGRGTKTYALTRAGLVAHDRWLCDVERAIGPGIDPFRTRASLWSALGTRRRHRLMQALAKELRRRHDELSRALPSLDEGDVIALRLHLALLDSRLLWLQGRRH
jgi:DNA-binding PadR family transcriptional regulator